MADTARTEAWLRGPVEGIDGILLPVAHALIQAREDLQDLATLVPHDQLWVKPGGAASVGFHIQHLGGALDRLFTYARGERLNDIQKAAFKMEAAPADPSPTAETLVAATTAQLDGGLAQLRATSHDRVLDDRSVGRAGLPSTVLGLLFHAAEHTTRHTGQATTTARILAGSPAA
jgi:hypothetical protein